MNTPPELKSKKFERAELLITLPAGWDLAENSLNDENNYWPLRWLKAMARFPIKYDTWLGWGHTVPVGELLEKKTEFCGVLVTMPYFFGRRSVSCKLPNKDVVRFYQLVPLYENEMLYKIEQGANALEASFSDDFDMVVDVHRKNLFQQ